MQQQMNQLQQKLDLQKANKVNSITTIWREFASCLTAYFLLTKQKIIEK